MFSFIASTEKLVKYALLTAVFGILYQTDANAQCTPLANAVPNISYSYIQTNGTNASGVAYNPCANVYYCGIAGNPGFPMETFDAAGTSLFQTNTGFDLRGLWWNPAQCQLEANGYNTTGIWTWNLDASNNAINTGTSIFAGNNQPNAQSCGDLDYDANEIIYYNAGTIWRYDRATNAMLGNYPITGLPVGTGNINSYGITYTGCPGFEIGILDYVLKRFYFIDKTTGAYAGMSQLPAAAVTNNSFRFSYANDLAWLYDVGTRTWFSYQVLSGATPNSGGLSTVLPADTTLCAGQTLALDATTPCASNYLWQDGTTSATYTVSTAGTYYVDVTGGLCATSDTIVVTYVTAGSLNLGNDTIVCPGQTVTLDATTPGATYTWQDASTNPTFTVTTAGTYYCDVSTGGGCIVTDTINVSYGGALTVNLGNDTTLCTGATLTLDATNPGSTYIWQDASTNPTFTVTAAGTYYVDVDNGGCTGTDTIVVTYFSVNGINIGNDTALCAGATLTLDATTAGATYAWQDASTNPTFTVTSAGTYYVDVTVSGCIGTDTIVVTYNPIPTVNLGNDTVLCPGATLLLDAGNPGMTYLWQDNSTNQTFTATGAGTYTVDVTDLGCTGSGSINVTVMNLTPPDAGLDVSYCDGDPINDLIATALNGGTITWYADPSLTIAVGSLPNLTPANIVGVVTYYATETVGACESAADAVTVTITALPVAPVLSADATYCQGDIINDLTGTAGAGGTLTWYDDAALTNTVGAGASLTPSGALGTTTYYVTETVNGCTGPAAAVNVTVNPTPPAPTAGTTAIYCTGDPIADLIATPGSGGTINWYLGASLTNLVGTGNTYTPLAIVGSTDYYVTETVLGCESSPVIVTITVIDPPSAVIFGDSVLCLGESTVLTASGFGTSMIWNTGSSAGTITVSPWQDSTWYSVTYTNGCGTATDSILVIVNPLPNANAGIDTLVGIGNSYELTPSGGVTYVWSPDTWLTCTECENPITNPLLDTAYVVLVTDANGCSARDTVRIEVDPEMTIYIPNIFSPNGDGINDELFVRGNGIDQIHFLIFDRWGALIFETTDQSIGWDGSHNGKPFNTGVFAYILRAKLITGETEVLKGNVTIVK